MISLKELTISQSESLLIFEVKNRPFFKQFVPDRPDDYYTIEGISNTIQNMHELRSEDEYYLYLLVNEEDEIMGRVNVYNINRLTNTAEIGYRIGQDFNGSGYATKAVHLVCEEAKNNLNLSELIAKTISINIASERVLQKNNFVKVETIQRHLPFNGEWYDANVFMKKL